MKARGGKMRFVQYLLALCAAFALQGVPAAATRGTALPSAQAVDSASLRSIAAWLIESGKEGFLAADVADAAGIPRSQAEQVLEAKQRGFRSGEVLRIAQVSTDEKREFLLFMAQRPDGEVLFFLSSVNEGLKRAFVSIPGMQVVMLEREEALARFQQEISFWQARRAGL